MKKTLVFHLDASSTKALNIRLEEVHKEGSLLKWVGGNRKLYKDAILDLRGDIETAVFKPLFEQKNQHLRSLGRRESEDTIDYSIIPVDLKSAQAILKLLGGTGRLYFNRKELAVNLFSKFELGAAIQPLPNRRVGVKGMLKTPSRELSFADCDFIFPGKPPFVIAQGILYFCSADTSWNLLEKFYQTPSLEMSLREWESLKELISPSLISGTVQAASIIDPLPILKLEDDRGGFANLLLDYEGVEVPLEEPINKWRNLKVEHIWKADLIEAGYKEKQMGNTRFYCPLDRVQDTLHFLLEMGWEVRDRKGNKVVPQKGSSWSVSASEGGYLLRGRLSFGSAQTNISTVLLNKNTHSYLIPLEEGVVGLLSKGGFLGVDGEIAADGVKISRYDVGALQEFFERVDTVDCSEELRLLVQSLKQQHPATPVPLGLGFHGELRDYQQKGVAWLTSLHRNGLHGILADDMGLGKTVQVIAFLSTLALSHPVLIVMPKTLLYNWKNEFEKFFPDLPVRVHHGTGRQPLQQDGSAPYVLLTSYGTLRQDIALFEKVRFSCIILDEAQTVKNAESQASKAVCSLNGDFRLSLTGTPIENHFGEILAHFRFLLPDLLKNDNRLFDPARWKKKLRPYILRRKKEEVSEQLPEKIEQLVWLDMEPEQKALYDSFLKGIKSGLMQKVRTDGGGRHRLEMLEAILRLRQMCCHPLLFRSDAETPLTSSKMEALLSDVDVILQEGKKVLVFSQFVSMLTLLRKQMDARGWAYAYLDGETKDREGAVKQFQQDPDTRIFLISLKAGGVGMNLTAADYVFLYDPWWNEAVENQAIDRAHRIGRRDVVIAKRYLIKDSIEERMMLLKQTKKALAENILDGAGELLSAEDLEFLLSEGE